MAAALVIGSFALPADGGAHAWSLLYEQRWSQADRPLKWVVAPSIHVVAPDWIPYIKHGANQWNAIGSTLQFSYIGLAPDEGGGCGTAAGVSIVRRAHIPPPAPGSTTAGETWRCPHPSEGVAKSFVIQFNTKALFYAGALDPPAGHFDVWAVASHEFGHATGWGAHYDAAPDRGSLCEESNQRKHTMCATIAESNQRMRTLEEHDVYTFWNAYPGPEAPTCVRCLPTPEI